LDYGKSENMVLLEVPEEVKLSIKALGDDTRLSIVMLLLENDKMAFSQLKQVLSLSSSSLSNHLTILQDGGIVNNFLELRNNKYSYYTMTEMGTNLIKSIYNIVGLGSPLTLSKLPVTYGGTGSGSVTNVKKSSGWSKYENIFENIKDQIESTKQINEKRNELMENSENINRIQEFYRNERSRKKFLNGQGTFLCAIDPITSWT
jgi:DNA-binding transcriptional ArsR family regulator